MPIPRGIAEAYHSDNHSESFYGNPFEGHSLMTASAVGKQNPFLLVKPLFEPV